MRGAKPLVNGASVKDGVLPVKQKRGSVRGAKPLVNRALERDSVPLTQNSPSPFEGEGDTGDRVL
jgi:hypothetical protein